MKTASFFCFLFYRYTHAQKQTKKKTNPKTITTKTPRVLGKLIFGSNRNRYKYLQRRQVSVSFYQGEFREIFSYFRTVQQVLAHSDKGVREIHVFHLTSKGKTDHKADGS